jgi:hypothetical protein
MSVEQKRRKRSTTRKKNIGTNKQDGYQTAARKL